MSVAQRYFPRSPRYIFRLEDQTLMRFAAMETRGVAVTTKILNLSETGILFMMGEGDAPEEGDVLKIEFTVPDRKQIACFATVVRVDESSTWTPESGDQRSVVIGVQFRNLPEGHRRALNLGLQGKTVPEETVDWNHARQNQMAVFTGLSLAVLAVMMVLVTPPAKWIALFKSAIFLM